VASAEIVTQSMAAASTECPFTMPRRPRRPA
jgi:hypothetical protein